MSKGTPKVTDMKVIPVAGYDSMLLTVSGAHAPCFTRNLVILTDSSGKTGVGEIHGGETITKALCAYTPLIIGQPIGDVRRIVHRLRCSGSLNSTESEGLQRMDIANLKHVVHAETAVECALLDLLGQFMDLPVAALLGDGMQRREVLTLGYLFYIGDAAASGLDYRTESTGKNAWHAIRNKTTLSPQAVVEQAQAAKEHFGFKDFKLKGGVLNGEKEIQTVQALAKAFPDARITIDPNGAWSLDEAIALCKDVRFTLAYAEDPCGPEKGYSSREIMSEFKRATNIPVATNMIATDWRQFHHAVLLNAIDIPLADPHFWTMSGAVRVAQVCSEWGFTWGSHSNNHFDVSLAIFAHVAAAAPGPVTAMDTHWIWQEGQELAKEPLRIQNGHLRIPEKPGLGIELDMEKVAQANALYTKLPGGDRDDAVAMRRIIPGWKFDPNKPCMVR